MKTVLTIALSICLLTGPLTRSQGLPLGQDIDGARLDWSPDGTMLAITDNQTVEIIDATNLQTVNSLPSAAGYITDVEWSPGGTKIAISYGFNIEIWNQPWDSTSAQLERTLQVPDSVYNIVSLDWHPSGNMLLAVIPSVVHVWDVSSSQLVRTFSPNPAPLLSASWSHNGNKIALGDIKGRIIVEDITTNETKMEQVYDQDAIFSLSWKNTDEYLAAGTASSIIQLIRLGNFGGAGTIYAGDEDITAIDWHPTSSLLATGSPNGTVAIWDADTLQLVLRIDTGYPIPSIKWNSTGDRLAYSNGNGNVTIVQLPVADAGPDQVLTDSDSNGTELVTMNGSGSSDVDGTIVGYRWTEDDVEIATGVSPQVVLPVGIHTITLIVTDDDGLTDTDTVVITVEENPQEDLILSSQCSPYPDTKRVWQVSNTNDTAINFTWEVVQTSETGTGSVPAGTTENPGVVTFETQTVSGSPGTVRIFVDAEQNDEATVATEYLTNLTVETVGVYADGTWRLRNSNNAGPIDNIASYGSIGSTPMWGDWNGDGFPSIGYALNGTFRMTNDYTFMSLALNSPQSTDYVISFGLTTDAPLFGDWDGDGIDSIGINRNNNFYLRNTNSSGYADITVTYGLATDIGVIGDWDGDGIDTIGIYRPSNGTWYLRNTNSTGYADVVIYYPAPSGDYIPIVGNWDGDCSPEDELGFYRSLDRDWRLRINGSENVFPFGIISLTKVYLPIVGNWNNQ